MNLSSIFSQIFGQAAEHLPIDDPRVAQAVRLVSKMQMHLQSTWGQAQRMGIHCEQKVRTPTGEVLRCVEPMASTCVACRRPVCLFHSAIVPDSGDLICFFCIGAAQKAAQARSAGQGPTDYTQAGAGGQSSRSEAKSAADDEKLRKKYLKRLKLTGDPTEDEIKAAFKREAAKAHPDRVAPDKRAKAHEKFVGLGEARDWLLARKGRKAA